MTGFEWTLIVVGLLLVILGFINVIGPVIQVYLRGIYGVYN